MSPVAQHLDQFGGIGVEFAGGQQMHVALDPRPPHVAVQVRVRDRKTTAIARVDVARDLGVPVVDLLVAAKIDQRRAILSRLAIVAPDAAMVQHRLHLAMEREAARRAVPGRDLRRTTERGQRQLIGRRARVLRFVAAGTRDDFAGHPDDPGAFQLQRFPLAVQRLERDRLVGRNAKVR